MIKLKSIFCIAISFFLLSNCFGQKPTHGNIKRGIETIDHTSWDILLKKYVDNHGNVDYKEFKQDRRNLDDYLVYLAENPIANTASAEEQLAYLYQPL